MIVTYHTTASRELQGNGWVAYWRNKSGITNIFEELWIALLNKRDAEFHELRDILEEAERTATSKAYCNIMGNDREVEVMQYGILPIIWVIPQAEVDRMKSEKDEGDFK